MNDARAGLSQRLPLPVTQPDAPLDVVAEDTILRDEIFMSHQQPPIDRPLDLCEQVFPVHRLSLRFCRLF
jgi:hypothetical protein